MIETLSKRVKHFGWLLLATCLCVHPLLLEIHEFTPHPCDVCDHDHGCSSGEFASSGAGSSTSIAPCGSGSAHDPALPSSSPGPSQGADLDAASGTPGPSAPTGTQPHHCYHCVLCHAGAQAWNPPQALVVLDPGAESYGVIATPNVLKAIRGASSPAEPRGPPSLS